MTEGFGSSLWKNVQAVRLGTDGGLEAPVRADDDGVFVGLAHVAEADAARPRADATTTPRRRGWWSRLRRRS